MQRPDFFQEVEQGKMKCHVLIITSAFSPYKDEAYSFFARLEKRRASILESFETINAFFEDPGKCGEGMLLLMQGCGMAPTLKTRTSIRAGPVHRTASMCEEEWTDRNQNRTQEKRWMQEQAEEPTWREKTQDTENDSERWEALLSATASGWWVQDCQWIANVVEMWFVELCCVLGSSYGLKRLLLGWLVYI